MSDATVNAHGPESVPLLHNSGGYPHARIVWRGLRTPPNLSEEDRIEIAGQHGSWLRLRCVLTPSSEHYGKGWNSARRLLHVVEPDDRSDEANARERLLRLIDVHARGLEWPRALLASDGKQPVRDGLVLDDALTTFAALAKSTGAVWLRERPPVLAPLHVPLDVRGSGGTGDGRRIEWSTALWFPAGVPDNLLQAVRLQRQRRTSP
jgi:hypothetical protein